MATRQHKNTSQYSPLPLPLEGTEQVEVWRDGAQYQTTLDVLGGNPGPHGESHESGSDRIGTQTPTADAIVRGDDNGQVNDWVADASTNVKGKVQLAENNESAANKAVQSNDTRMSNARTPTAHAASHLGGTDDLGLGTAALLDVDVANGVCGLDSSGLVSASKLPSYVDDVVETYIVGSTAFAVDWLSLTVGGSPLTPESGKVYLVITAGNYYHKQYRWTGSVYGLTGSDLALGETSTTAYRGDRGKTAYDHSLFTGNPHQTRLKNLIHNEAITDCYNFGDVSIDITAVGSDNMFIRDKSANRRVVKNNGVSILENDQIAEIYYAPRVPPLFFTGPVTEHFLETRNADVVGAISTITLLFQNMPVSGNRCFFSQYIDANNYFNLIIDNSGAIEGYGLYAGSSYSRKTQNGVIPNTNYESYVIVYKHDGSVYVNNVEYALTGTIGAIATSSTAGVCWIGRGYGLSSTWPIGKLFVLRVSTNTDLREFWYLNPHSQDSGWLLPSAILTKLGVDNSSRVAEYTGDGIPLIPDNVAGATYVNNKNFTTADGWAAYNCAISYANGKMILTATGTNPGITRAVTASKTVIVAFRKISGNATNSIIANTTGTIYSSTKSYTISDKQIHSMYIGAGATGLLGINVGVTGSASGDVYEIDFIYIGTGAYDTPALDRSGNGNNLTLNAVTPVNGKYGKEMSFNGSTSYAQASSPVIGTGGTVSIRFKQINNTGLQFIFNSADGSNGLTLSATNGVLNISADGAGVNIDSIASEYVTFSFCSDGKVYKNGALHAQANTWDVVGIRNLILGAGTPGAFGAFNGIISHIRIDSRVWTADEALAWSLNPSVEDSIAMSVTPSAGKAMVWKTGVIRASLSTTYFTGFAGEFTLTQINDVLYIHSDISFAARTITAGDTVFTFTGLSVSSYKVANYLVGVDTTTVRTLAGWVINISPNGSGTIIIYPKGDRDLIGGQILNATGLYGDASSYLG